MLSRSSMLAAALGTAVSAAACVAQTYPTFNLINSEGTPGLYTGNIYTADLNNDGVPDLIVDEYSTAAGEQQPYFAVFLAKGDGTFWGPAWCPYSSSSIPPGDTGPGAVPFAFGDFNGDGNVDVAMPVGNDTIAVYLGKGDGTFANPWYSVINFPSNQYVLTTYESIVAADFNHDGKLDLAVVGVNGDGSAETVYVLPGEGNGLFSDATPVLTIATYTNGSGGVQSVLTGDFDGDTNADLVVNLNTGSANGRDVGSSIVHVLYGDGNFGFADTSPISGGEVPQLLAGDLNSDGKSDLYSIGSTIQTWYGQGDRTFASYTQQLPAASYVHSAQPMADFNNDGLNDFVTIATTYTDTFVALLLAQPGPGQFEVQTWNVPNAAEFGSVPVVGDFNHDGKPDWAYIGQSSTGPYNNTISTPYSGLNATVGQLWSDCDYPAAGRGINLCSPAITSGSTVNFNATAHSFADLRKMELWVDGTKLGEQYHTWEGNGYFNFSSTLAPGTHSGTYFAADFDNSLLQYNFNFTVPSSCAAPTSPGVNLCAPGNGSSISSQSVLVQASANITGTLARMEIWVDSTKKYTETDSTSLSTAVMATPGTHQFTVYAVNMDGTVWSQAVTATTQ
jgi:VCBS repeat protein/Big-like domain-containing protein